jgi:hypothetical protein
MVQVIAGAVDYGDAAEVYVSRVARVSRISNSIVRITFCVEREGPHGVEHRVVLHALFDIDDLAVEMEKVRKALDVVRSESPLRHNRLINSEWH